MRAASAAGAGGIAVTGFDKACGSFAGRHRRLSGASSRPILRPPPPPETGRLPFCVEIVPNRPAFPCLTSARASRSWPMTGCAPSSSDRRLRGVRAAAGRRRPRGGAGLARDRRARAAGRDPGACRRPCPRRAADVAVLRPRGAGDDRAPRRPPGHHPLALRRRDPGAPPGDRPRFPGALRRRGKDPHRGGQRRRDRPVPSCRARGFRARPRQRRGAPPRRAAAPGGRPGPVHRGAGAARA